MNDSAPSPLTLLEARQLLGAVRQSNEILIEALLERLTGVTATTVRHLDGRIVVAIRNHRESVAKIWEPATENGISAAARKPHQADGLKGSDSFEGVVP